MRQVFSSARLENVEAVAKLLADAGIEVRIENGRTFRSSIRGNFSYRDGGSADPKPAVWVVRSDDQPHARQLLRDNGLLDAAPSSKNSFLPMTAHAATAAAPKKRNGMRFGLLVLVAIAVAVALNPLRDPGGWDLPAPRPAAQARVALDPSLLPVVTSADTAHRIPTPPALAAMLAARAADPGSTVCATVDGEDAGPAIIKAGQAHGATVVPASTCTADGKAIRLQVAQYLTDGSGTGTIEVETLPVGGAEALRERLEVRRDEDDWRVLRTL